MDNQKSQQIYTNQTDSPIKPEDNLGFKSILIIVIVIVVCIFIVVKIGYWIDAEQNKILENNLMIESNGNMTLPHATEERNDLAEIDPTGNKTYIYITPEGVTYDLYAKRELLFYYKDENDLGNQIRNRLKTYAVFDGYSVDRQNGIISNIMLEYEKMPQDRIKNVSGLDKDEFISQVDMFPILGNGYLMSVFFQREVDLSFLGLVRSSYSRDDNFIYHNGYRMPSDIDINSFVALEQRWAKDDNHVYKDNNVVNDIYDPRTFIMVTDSFGKDDYYQYTINNNLEITRIDNIDPESSEFLFTIDEVEYYKDKDGFFFVRPSGTITKRFDSNGTALNLIGISSEVQYLSVDKDVFIYLPWHGENNSTLKSEGVYRIADANSSSFKVLENKFSLDGSYLVSINSFAKDNKNVYYVDEKIDGADPRTYRVLWGGYGKDDNTFYYNQHKLINYDLGSFEIIDCGYAKDKDHVYFGDHILEGADVASFKIEMYCRAKDNNYSYDNGVRI